MMRSRGGVVWEWIGLIVFLAACLLGYLTLGGDDAIKHATRRDLARPYVAPDRIHVSVDDPEPARLQAIFSGGYGTLARDVGDSFVEAPALFVSVSPTPNYRGVFDRTIKAALVPGQTVAVIASGTGVGTLHELSVVEVLAGGDGTLSEYLIEEGYAVPRADLLREHLRSEQLTAALRRARAARSGYWAETYGSGAAAGLGRELDEATAPIQGPAPWFRRVALATMIAVVLVLAWREAYWRKIERENKSWKSGKTGVAARIAGAFFTGGWLNLFLRPGFGRTLPPAGAGAQREEQAAGAKNEARDKESDRQPGNNL